MKHQERIKAILDYWFGDLTQADLPNPERTAIWFSGGENTVDAEIRALFSEDLNAAITGKYDDWVATSHGRLCLILLFDQFTRNLYRGTEKAYMYDVKALDLCLTGIEVGHDHNLTLIERVFFYMPLEHAEDLLMQERSVIAFQNLQAVSMPETRIVYDGFLQFAVEHYEVIKEFGRFPSRNKALGRESTIEEQAYLANSPKF